MKWLIGSVLLILLCCKRSEPPLPSFPSGNFTATASFNANLSAGEPFSNYTTEYMAIRAMGARGAQTAAPWSSLNPTGNTYDLTPLSNPYFGLTKFSEYGYESIFLNIPIITVNTRSMPADISSLSFDDPAVKVRLHALIDEIQSLLIPQVKYIALGNEVDTYLSSHPGEWNAYKALVEDGKNYLQSLKPNLTVGVTTTFAGATNTSITQVRDLNANMDAVMLTYYPVSGAFVPREPGTVTADVAKMVEIVQGKPLIMQEWGYPSSSLLGSSEKNQAQFIYNSLVELEKQGISRFPFVSFFKYRDWSPGFVQSLTGQKAGQPFYEFMGSLGLKRNDGTPKESFGVMANWIKP